MGRIFPNRDGIIKIIYKTNLNKLVTELNNKLFSLTRMVTMEIFCKNLQKSKINPIDLSFEAPFPATHL